jgi:hypothetical protein
LLDLDELRRLLRVDQPRRDRRGELRDAIEILVVDLVSVSDGLW